MMITPLRMYHILCSTPTATTMPNTPGFDNRDLKKEAKSVEKKDNKDSKDASAATAVAATTPSTTTSTDEKSANAIAIGDAFLFDATSDFIAGDIVSFQVLYIESSTLFRIETTMFSV
jgi:hypothetical protein